MQFVFVIYIVSKPSARGNKTQDMTTKRLKDIISHLVPRTGSSPLSEMASLPTFDELPSFKNFPGCAWSVWGTEDQLGTVNLLTEEVVQQAASEEIKYALIVLASHSPASFFVVGLRLR